MVSFGVEVIQYVYLRIQNFNLIKVCPTVAVSDAAGYVSLLI
jgi:hypothetical protein